MAVATELNELRRENSKTFSLSNGRRALEVSIGAIHYKDNYADISEQWKDIDLNWEGNRIVKAPYELTLEANKVTVRDKKTGDISTIELLEIGGIPIPAQAWEHSKGLAKAFDTDLEIISENSRVRFAHILKSDKAPKEAKYRVTGKIPLRVRARDTEGELPVEWALKDGILTETLKSDRLVKYPVRIDPTLDLQVAASADDDFMYRYFAGGTYWVNDHGRFQAGNYSADYYEAGGAARFTNVTIPQGSTIDVAYLTLRCSIAEGVTTVNTMLCCNDADTAVAPTDYADHIGKARTADVAWNSIGAWTLDTDYNSPSIVTPVQTVINRVGWASGNALMVFWEDRDGLSSTAAIRVAYSYDSSTTYCPKLHAEYSVSVTITAVVATATAEALTPTLLFDYVRLASVITGSTVSASRAAAVIRSSAVITGVLVSAYTEVSGRIWSAVVVGTAVSASKVWGSVKTATTITGVLVTASRAIATTRASAVITGVVASATKIFGSVKSSSVIVGVVVSASRVIAAIRSSIVLIGNLVTASKVWGSVKSANVNIGSLVSASRLLGIIRSASVSIGNLVSASRDIVITRASSVLVGNLVSASKAIAVIRSSSVVIGVLVSASRIWGVVKSASVLIGNLVSATRTIKITRAASVTVGIVVTATRALSIVRSALVAVGVLVSASKIWGVVKSASVVVGNLVTASFGLSRNLSVYVITTMYRKIKTWTYGGKK